MEINAEKTKLMTKNTSGINTEIEVNGLSSSITDQGSKFEILSKTAQTTAALTRLKPVWNHRVFLSVQRYDAPLSYSSSCMLVNQGPSQQSSKEDYKPWK